MSLLALKTNDIEMIEPNLDDVTLVQITDTHLFSDSEGELLGVNTLNSFSAVVNDVLESGLEYHAIIMTGDVSQDHTDVSYSRFEHGILPLKQDCYWLPGNHDYKPSMHSIYPSTQIKDDTYLQIGKHWQVILLDSQVEGSPHGFLSEQQLEYLDSVLKQHPDRFSLVLLHHHPVLVGSQWLDKHCLHNSNDFWGVIKPHQNVKGILCGHVHQDFHQVHLGVSVVTSPSTCIQFKPNSDDFALEKVSPGWRALTLKANGVIDTQVYRLADEAFLPDFDAQGY